MLMIVHARYPVGEPRVERQAVAAVGAGFDVAVVCLREPGEPAREVVDGVTVHRLPVRHRRGSAALMAFEYLAFLMLATVYAALLTLRRRYDIVHVSNPPDLLVLAGLVPKLRGAMLVFDVHDLTPDLFEWRFEGSRAGPVVFRLLVLQERLACRLSDRLITVHETCAALLEDRSAPAAKKASIVMNTLDERLLPPGAAAETNGTSAFHDPVQLVYHGTLTELYGVHVLVDALRDPRLRGRMHLEVIGDGDALPALRAQVAGAGLEEMVEFSGRTVPIREALERVAARDVGVVPLAGLPINRFSLPSKLFEYVALGLPVVASRTETLARHFGEDELAYFVPGDADDLADRLVELLEQPEQARERAARARRRYEQYRWPLSRQRLLEVIEPVR
jgi:glycosyltransferase involved in cell wall biosynthesis